LAERPAFQAVANHTRGGITFQRQALQMLFAVWLLWASLSQAGMKLKSHAPLAGEEKRSRYKESGLV